MDERTRQLERLAAQGDEEAGNRLDRVRRRANPKRPPAIEPNRAEEHVLRRQTSPVQERAAVRTYGTYHKGDGKGDTRRRLRRGNREFCRYYEGRV